LKFIDKWAAMVLAASVLMPAGCATSRARNIGLGMAAGAVVGAVVGHEYIHHGRYNQYDTRNTIITSVIFTIATGLIMNWHYLELQEREVEISSKYSRYRLCNPDEMIPNLGAKLGANEDEPNSFQLQPGQIGKSAITLDDSTKWVFPVFRKRFLLPERGDSSVMSTRYIWEILKPGNFVTRSQDPQYFLEEEAK
jgi:hypothetical protein